MTELRGERVLLRPVEERDHVHIQRWQNAFSLRDETCSLYVFVGEPDARGLGFGSDAILTLLRWGFDRFGLYLVQLWGLSTNERAMRAYDKLGLRVDGARRERSRQG